MGMQFALGRDVVGSSWSRQPVAMVERHERRPLESALARAADGDPSLVVVAGDAGVGKSCLLRAVVESADATVLFGTCAATGDVTPPLAPIVEALRSGPVDSAGSSAVADVLDLLLTGTTRSERNPLACRTEIFQAFLDLINGLAEERPTLVVLEDVHVADRSTLDLVAFVLSNLRRQRLAIMVSYRSEALVADHPWRPVLAELVRHPRVDHVDVAPFDRRQVAEQLACLTGRPADDTTIDEIMLRTDGNPYFVEELIDSELDTLRPITLSLRELLLVRVDALEESTRRLLRIMALGRPSTTEAMLAEVAGITVGAVRTAQRAAIDHRVLAVGPSGVEFRHALVREALEQDLLAGELRELHAAFARAMVRSGEPSGRDRAGHFAALAHHWLGAGDVAASTRASVEAAVAAERMFAWAEAHDQFERVVERWDRLDEPQCVTGLTRRDLLACRSGSVHGRYIGAGMRARP